MSDLPPDISRLELNDTDFSCIQQLVLENTGISLSISKKELVKRRFSPRIKDLGLGGFDSYIDYFKNNHELELTSFCNAITTNLTSFFREKHHYDYLRSEALPIILKRNSLTRKLRIWSAGCSTGQEAYCIAMILRESIPDIHKWDVKILATDLDEKCLTTARDGRYKLKSFDKVSDSFVSDYFIMNDECLNGRKDEFLVAKQELKQLITFNKLNLMQSWPMKGLFDVIFCRNVFIYFEKNVQLKIIQRYSQLQQTGSFLCLGHSETVPDPGSVGYKLIGKTLYKRI